MSTFNLYAPEPGDKVNVTQTQTTGTEIGSVTINGDEIKLFAPDVDIVTPTEGGTTGMKVATINGTDLYAHNPNGVCSCTVGDDDYPTITTGTNYITVPASSVTINASQSDATSLIGYMTIYIAHSSNDSSRARYINMTGFGTYSSGTWGKSINILIGKVTSTDDNYTEYTYETLADYILKSASVYVGSDLDTITINYNAESSGSSSGSSGSGSTVTVTQTQTSGTEIGAVTVDGTETKLYAPDVTVSQDLTSGTKIASVNGTQLYAPSKPVVYGTTVAGFNCASVDGTNIIARVPTWYLVVDSDSFYSTLSGLTAGTKTIKGSTDTNFYNSFHLTPDSRTATYGLYPANTTTVATNIACFGLITNCYTAAGDTYSASSGTSFEYSAHGEAGLTTYTNAGSGGGMNMTLVTYAGSTVMEFEIRSDSMTFEGDNVWRMYSGDIYRIR